MGGGSGPEAPDPMELAEAQRYFNREALADTQGLTQTGEYTPWGSTYWKGAIGSPGRRRVVEINPADKYRLDQERAIKSQLLGMVLGGGGAPPSGQAEPSWPTGRRPTGGMPMGGNTSPYPSGGGGEGHWTFPVGGDDAEGGFATPPTAPTDPTGGYDPSDPTGKGSLRSGNVPRMRV